MSSFQLDNIFLENIIDSLNCGVFVVDKAYKICLWNNFMSSHSHLTAQHVLGHCLFELFEELPKTWLQKKLDSVFILKNFAFTTWEQRPFLFNFYHNRPASSNVAEMRQNCTFIPVKDTSGTVQYVCVTLQDVTDTSIYQSLLEESKLKIEQQSQIDGLTGVFNRKHWEETLRHELNRVKRYETPLTVILLDFDRFKQVNDTFGHLAGDEVLRSAAKLITDCLRECDTAGRYGGEEFGIILSDTSAEGGIKTAERIRRTIEKATVIYNKTHIPITVSLGIASLDEKTENVDQLVDHADRALYHSKKNGRNKVTLYNETLFSST